MGNSKKFIPVNVPVLEEREKEFLIECIDTGWISSEGEFVKSFEDRFAHVIGSKHGVAVCNGTAALELAVASLGLSPGDEIIVPSFTIISCVLAVIRNGLKPVLVDSENDTWNMDIDKIRNKITDRTRAIMPVHIYGHPVDMEPLIEIARMHNLFIIEDAAEAHGAKYKNKYCGTLGDISVFSFYANKIITTGEGGMVLTNDDNLANRLKVLRNLGFEASQRFLHYKAGWNFRLSNLQAAVGLAQVERFDRLIDQKKKQGIKYRELLCQIEEVQLQVIKRWADPVYWVNGIVLKDSVSFDAKEFAKRLLNKGIQTRPFFWPMHQQPVFREAGLFLSDCHPVSEKLARRGLYLPSGMALTENQIVEICDAVKVCLYQE